MYHSALWLAAYLGSSLSYLLLLLLRPEAAYGWHKAIPVSLLALWVIRIASARYRPVIALACIASLSGDFVLAINVSWAFIAGLSCFLLAHCGYAVAFWQLAKQQPWPRLCVLVLIYWLLCLTFLVPNSGQLALPVSIYASVISVMLCLAIKTQNPHIIGGACLFTLSDSLIAYDRFLQSFEAADLMIMTTYYTAQLLLIWPFVQQPKKHNFV
ncbi:lysoplasmalogenase [Alteromonas flava]|uniref:lysoplasmalogenase n=1 Tax=Alteromonas flava TaxID=2048003 RepID=UPI000C28AE4D|nr:lysoplasmalogenase [Alteromonas flava]